MSNYDIIIQVDDDHVISDAFAQSTYYSPKNEVYLLMEG
jgi:hypothetical protein